MPKKNNPYVISEPTIISFSGGRSSALMLHKTLDANGGIPDGSVVCFANTGKEMPETLDFVHECEQRWGVPIVWLELADYKIVGEWASGLHKGKPKFKAVTKVVDYSTASRNGEPFEILIRKKAYLPNAVARICTAELKVRRIQQFCKDNEIYHPVQFIGIRADEQRRAAKIHNSVSDGCDRWCPMYVDGVTKETVSRFWKDHPFDLNLPNNNGTTDWGNCDLCFLKGAGKRKSIIQQRPDLADWWIRMEKETESRFRNDTTSYADLKVIAKDNGSFDFGVDVSIPCYCGD